MSSKRQGTVPSAAGEPCGGCCTFGLAEGMAMESGATIDRSAMEASRKPLCTGGEVESSELTARHSRDAFEHMAENLARASPSTQ
ncbi:ribonuclease D [Micractinium conductrix]|uniref:Ribonuclease D n=1 Tax=Micractinium conductrix TaxID=554055 RepID=A0A2P6V5H3_9CHLO|nr:ribonuclease D [Micractinium conductrix]|eukprot:PSC69345.1 ribonuclease D [Micractinium conductrix]